jgi:hypothetical protein
VEDDASVVELLCHCMTPSSSGLAAAVAVTEAQEGDLIGRAQRLGSSSCNPQVRERLEGAVDDPAAMSAVVGSSSLSSAISSAKSSSELASITQRALGDQRAALCVT